MFQSIRTINSQEGLKGLYRGGLINVMRSSMLNFGTFVTYDTLYQRYLEKTQSKNKIYNRLGLSLIAGMVASCISLPFDNIKTKL